jgi:hypothetical protein
MPPGTNGTVAGRRIYRAAPKTTMFSIEVERLTPAGKPKLVVIDVIGHHKEPGSVFVSIEVEAAWARWRADSYVEVTDPKTGEVSTEVRETDLAEANLRIGMLTAVLREAETDQPLQERDAEVLARDGGGWRDILEELGWLSKTAEDRTGPEAGGEASTRASSLSSPESLPSTTASPEPIS